MNTTGGSLFLDTTLALAAACGGGSTRDLDPDLVRWVEYEHPTAGYRLQVPAQLRAVEDGDEVLFRYDGGVPVLVRLTTEREGRARGAWFGHPDDGPDVLAGRPCRRIVYDHHDGPFSSRTIAYVLPVGDRFLGLEFRSPGPLDPVQRRMLESFRLE